MENSMQGEKLVASAVALEIVSSVVKLPPLPAAGMRLLAMARQPVAQIDLSAFAGLVETDPGLLSRVLQLANSPYYSSVHKIVGLRKAIIRIGLDEAINSVCLYFFQKMLPKIPPVEGFSVKDCWAHSWACAVAARRLGHPNLKMDVLPGELYIAGLLHGIGKLILAIHDPRDFSHCVRKARDHKRLLHEVEMDVFGTTDGLVASIIMENWGLPDSICTPVGFYTNPPAAPKAFQEMAGLIQLAWCISGLSGIGASGDGCLMEIHDPWILNQDGCSLNDAKTRQEVIQEIVLTLEKKSESVTGVAPKAESFPGVISSPACKQSSAVTGLSPGKRKGLLGKIAGLFRK